MSYHLAPFRMAIIKKSTGNKCWTRCGEKRTLLHCWWECKLIQPLCRTVWRFLKKLGIKLSYDPAIPLLDIYPAAAAAAAAAAKSLQSCPTLCDPIDSSPSGSAVPGIPQARTLEWIAISFSKCWNFAVPSFLFLQWYLTMASLNDSYWMISIFSSQLYCNNQHINKS